LDHDQAARLRQEEGSCAVSGGLHGAEARVLVGVAMLMAVPVVMLVTMPVMMLMRVAVSVRMGMVVRVAVGLNRRVRMVVRMPGRKRVLMGRRMLMAMLRVGRAGAAQRLFHDLLDRADAATALRAAAEAAVDLPGGPRLAALRTHRAAHVVVAQNIAGTNDHGSEMPLRLMPWDQRYLRLVRIAKGNVAISSYSKLQVPL